jgi:DNA-binding MarR family transcriptional regulator
MIRKVNKVSKREDECAREMLDAVPSVMRFIRAEMRSHRALGLSVPQFRSLVFIEKAAGTSLTAVAEHLGLTAPSACKLIDGLSGRGMVTRRESAGDRRRVTLEITPEGTRAVTDARAKTQKSLSALLHSLETEELVTVTRAMSALRRVFTTRSSSPTAAPSDSRSVFLSEGRSRPHGNS